MRGDRPSASLRVRSRDGAARGGGERASGVGEEMLVQVCGDRIDARTRREGSEVGTRPKTRSDCRQRNYQFPCISVLGVAVFGVLCEVLVQGLLLAAEVPGLVVRCQGL